MIGCEPGEVDDVGFGLTPVVEAAVERRDRRSCARRSPSCGPTRPTRPDARAVGQRSAVVDTVVRHAAGRRVTRRARCASGTLRQVVPDSLAFYFEHRLARDASARARGSSRSSSPARLRCGGCAREWEIGGRRRSAARRCGGAAVDVIAGNELEVESIEVGGGRMHRVKVRVVEDALDANNTIARGQPRRLRPRTA